MDSIFNSPGGLESKKVLLTVTSKTFVIFPPHYSEIRLLINVKNAISIRYACINMCGNNSLCENCEFTVSNTYIESALMLQIR